MKQDKTIVECACIALIATFGLGNVFTAVCLFAYLFVTVYDNSKSRE